MFTLMTRIEPEKNMDRWYSVSVQPTLLDSVAVVCAWGRRHTGYQRVRVLLADSSETAEEIAAGVVVYCFGTSRPSLFTYIVTPL